MRFIVQAAAAGLLALGTTLVSANNLCVLDQKVYYGRKAFVETDLINERLRRRKELYLSQGSRYPRLCPSAGSRMDEIICKAEIEAKLPSGHWYVKFESELKLDPGTLVGAYGSALTEKQRNGLGFLENEFDDLKDPIIYEARILEEYWEIDSTIDPRKEKFLNKVGEDNDSHQIHMLCGKNPNTIGFLNGVFTTANDARKSLKEITSEFGSEYKDHALDYQLLYNDTTCNGGVNASCLGDLAETFSQRQRQIDAALRGRWEFFWDMLAGRHASESSITGSFLSRLGAAANVLIGLDNYLRNKVVQLMTSVFTSYDNYATQSALLSSLLDSGRKQRGTLVVAHSQGNLFTSYMNEGFLTHVVTNTYEMEIPPLKFINVSPPTTQLPGDHLLADADLVIKGVSMLYPGTTPAANISIPLSASDLTGHKFIETYMDRSRPAFGRLRSMIAEAMDSF